MGDSWQGLRPAQRQRGAEAAPPLALTRGAAPPQRARAAEQRSGAEPERLDGWPREPALVPAWRQRQARAAGRRQAG